MVSGARESTACFKQWMGRWVTGVLTVLVPVDQGWHGMTANAFTSVSLDPALVLLCVDLVGNTESRLRKAGRFTVSMLSQQQRVVADRFSARDSGRRFLGLEEVALSDSGQPYLQGSLAWLACEVTEVMGGGDHRIFLARVVDGGHAEDDVEPLVYFRGHYR